MKEDTRLLDFYEERGTDHRGRTLSEVQRFTLDMLECEHDYIQWLFPLRTPSPVNSQAPTVTAHDIAQFRSSDVLRRRLRRSFETMLDFYGLAVTQHEGLVTVQRADTFALRAENWLTPGNHNFLRITRILTSLTILGQEDFARAYLECLRVIFADYRGIIGDRTWRFWTSAITGGD